MQTNQLIALIIIVGRLDVGGAVLILQYLTTLCYALCKLRQYVH